LQSAIDAVQTNIENETTDRLNSDVNLSNSLQALEITVNTKQAIINDGDLSISKVDGLQTALDTKQVIINDGDLTISKVDGLQTALDTKQTIINDGDLTISKVDGLQTALDTLSSGGGGGLILEKFSNYTQGQVWNTSKGNTTLYNFTAIQSVANLNYHTTVLGSEISYAPPTGTTKVEYEFVFNVYSFKSSDNNIILQTQLLIDDVPQTITRKRNKLTTNTSAEGNDVVCKYVIDITGTTDPAKLTLANWNSAKSIKVQLLYDCSTTTTFEIGKVINYKNFPPDPAPIGTFSYTQPPMLSITAY
jgi:hypothetical protein